MKRTILFFAILLIAYTANAQRDINFLAGKWLVTRRISEDPHSPLTPKESKECLGESFSFLPNSIAGPKSACFYGGCDAPHYKFKHVDALQYFEGDEEYLKQLNYRAKMIDVIETSCGVPFSYIKILDDNTISFGMDGYIYFLKRANVHPVGRNSR
jgi:hypothetical protein